MSCTDKWQPECNMQAHDAYAWSRRLAYLAVKQQWFHYYVEIIRELRSLDCVCLSLWVCVWVRKRGRDSLNDWLKWRKIKKAAFVCLFAHCEMHSMFVVVLECFASCLMSTRHAGACPSLCYIAKLCCCYVRLRLVPTARPLPSSHPFTSSWLRNESADHAWTDSDFSSQMNRGKYLQRVAY